MHAVDKPVVDLNGKAQRLAAIFLPDVFAPGDAGDGVVYIDLPLVCAAGEVEPRKTRDIDQIVRLGGRFHERRLCLAPILRGPAEVVQRALTRARDDLELFAALFQLRKAGSALIQQVNAAVPDSIAQVLDCVDGLRDEICHGIIKRQAVYFGIHMQLRHVHAEADAVKRLIERGEEGKNIPSRPAGQMDFLTGTGHKETSRL